jgi:hypothetical protein
MYSTTKINNEMHMDASRRPIILWGIYLLKKYTWFSPQILKTGIYFEIKIGHIYCFV